MTDSRPAPQRADATRNRERILEAARAAFAADQDASLNSIAKRAGIGAGTLYRHFATREELLLALYAHEVLQLAASVDAGLAEADDPLSAMRDWFLRLADYLRLKHGLGDALTAAAARQMTEQTYTPVIAAIGTLLRACEQAGQIRAGVDPDDLLLLMGFLWRVPDTPAGHRQAQDTLAIVIDGLRKGG